MFFRTLIFETIAQISRIDQKHPNHHAHKAALKTLNAIAAIKMPLKPSKELQP